MALSAYLAHSCFSGRGRNISSSRTTASGEQLKSSVLVNLVLSIWLSQTKTKTNSTHSCCPTNVLSHNSRDSRREVIHGGRIVRDRLVLFISGRRRRLLKRSSRGAPLSSSGSALSSIARVEPSRDSHPSGLASLVALPRAPVASLACRRPRDGGKS